MRLSDISNKEQTLDEASLATMRDYFAGQEDARDPLEITKQRMWFDKNKDKLANKRKEFRSPWEFNQWLKQHKLKALSDGSIVKEFAPSNGGDNGEEDALLKYARMWYNGDLGTQQQVEQVLARMGWEIGELESEEGGAFVVQAGDENGDSYIGFAVADLTEQQVAEMDSQGYTGSRDRKSMSKYGSRDDYELGAPEGTGKVVKPSDLIKKGAKALDNAFNHAEDDWSKDFERRMKKGNKIGEQSNYSPMVKDTMHADKIRSLKNLIAIAREQGRQVRVQELERELKKLQGVAESSGNIGFAIKSLYQKIHNAGDDEIEYFYHDSPIFAQYWDEYEGDLNSIIAEVDPEELQIIHDELESYVQQANLAEAHPNSKIYDKCRDGYRKVPGKKRGEKGSCVKESTSALSEAIQAVEGMRSVREGEPGIKRVTRKRVDDSTEVRYHVLDSNGVTHKSFDDLANAKRWLSANRDILSKD